MSYVFGLDSRGQQQQLETLTADWNGENDFGASAGAGIPTGLATGVMRGGVRAVRAGRLIATGIDSYFIPQDEADARFQAIEESAESALDYWTPNASEVGKVGQVLGSVSEMALPLMIGKGNPTFLGTSTALNTSADLVRQGVDAQTAGTVGVAEGGAVMLGAWLPVFGKSLGGKIAGNAAANAALGAGATAIDSAILTGAGYDEQAEQFDPFDWQARAVDVLMGAAFGAIHRGPQLDMRDAVFGREGAKRVQAATDSIMESIGFALKPSDMDAAFSAANIKHLQIDSAPGRPVDTDSWRAHGNAMETAASQLARGEPVDVTGQIDGAGFRSRPQEDMRAAMKDVVGRADDLDMPANRRAKAKAAPEPDVTPKRAGQEGAATNTTSAAAKQPASPDQQLAADRLVEVEHEIKALQAHLDERGDFDVSIAAGDDGGGSTTKPASRWLKEADEAVAEAGTMGEAIRAAVRCIMSFGE